MPPFLLPERDYAGDYMNPYSGICLTRLILVSGETHDQHQ